MLFQTLLNYKVRDLNFKLSKLLFILYFLCSGNCKDVNQNEYIKLKYQEKIKFHVLHGIFNIFSCENRHDNNELCQKTLIYDDEKEHAESIHFVKENDNETSLYCNHCYNKISKPEVCNKLILCTLTIPIDAKFSFIIFANKEEIKNKIDKIMTESFFNNEKSNYLEEKFIESKVRGFFSTNLLIRTLLFDNPSVLKSKKYYDLYDQLKLMSINSFHRNENIISEHVIRTFTMKSGILKFEGDNTCYINTVFQMLKVVYENCKENNSKFYNILNDETPVLSTFFGILEILTLNYTEIDIEDLLVLLEDSDVSFTAENTKFNRTNRGDLIDFLAYIFVQCQASENYQVKAFSNEFLFLDDQNTVAIPFIDSEQKEYYNLINIITEFIVYSDYKDSNYIIFEKKIENDMCLSDFLKTIIKKSHIFNGLDHEYECVGAIVFADFLANQTDINGHYVYVNEYNLYDDANVTDLNTFDVDSLKINSTKKSVLLLKKSIKIEKTDM